MPETKIPLAGPREAVQQVPDTLIGVKSDLEPPIKDDQPETGLDVTLSRPLAEAGICFHDLPHLVRQKIYRYTVVPGRVFVRPFQSYVRKQTNEEKVEVEHPNLALLRASKQIYKEAMPIFLGNNMFQIIHTDLLAALRTEYPRVRENLKMIRNVELVFNVHECPALLGFLYDDLVLNIMKLKETADNIEYKSEMLMQLMKANKRLRDANLFNEGNEFLLRNADRIIHDRQKETQKLFLWGRTMTFVREQFKLSRLHVNLKDCFCTSGCCRLAVEVLGWGWIFVWVLGPPEEVTFRGASKHEIVAIKKILQKQVLRPEMMTKEIYDVNSVIDPQEIQKYAKTLSNLRCDLQHFHPEQRSIADDTKAGKFDKQEGPVKLKKKGKKPHKKNQDKTRQSSVCPGCGRA